MEEQTNSMQEQEAQVDDNVVKVDLRNFNKEENAVQSENAEEAGVRVSDDDVSVPESTDAGSDNAESTNTVEERVQQRSEDVDLQNDGEPAIEVRVLEEVTDEPSVQEQVNEAQPEPTVVQEQPQIQLPENIEKLVEFMNDTGGTLEDYVKLNTDFSELDEKELIRQYYESKYKAYDKEDIDFLLSDKFDFIEDIDDEYEVKRKKLAFKEEVANARNHFESTKSKYYNDIKSGSKLTDDQQKAVDFFNRYNEEQEQQQQLIQKQQQKFVQQTENVFNQDFKGFDFKVGDKRFRYNVKDANQVKQNQMDLNNFIGKFLDKDNTISDAGAYHKALFTAMNADAIANHFYEQGKADAISDSISRSKNVDMAPRGQHEGVTKAGGMTVRAISGDSGSKLRVKFNK